MKAENIKSLEGLVLSCHIGGVMTLGLGAVVIFMDIINGDFRHIQVGIFICATAYAFVKISSKIAGILAEEQ
ncbi:MAG: hypothetical protein HZA29_04435 [Candidatus Omnitrophica bacterium]|nr:hypothetical protein [Candidatus Omnitrophota bacterium]